MRRSNGAASVAVSILEGESLISFYQAVRPSRTFLTFVSLKIHSTKSSLAKRRVPKRSDHPNDDEDDKLMDQYLSQFLLGGEELLFFFNAFLGDNITPGRRVSITQV